MDLVFGTRAGRRCELNMHATNIKRSVEKTKFRKYTRSRGKLFSAISSWHFWLDAYSLQR